MQIHMCTICIIHNAYIYVYTRTAMSVYLFIICCRYIVWIFSIYVYLCSRVHTYMNAHYNYTYTCVFIYYICIDICLHLYLIWVFYIIFYYMYFILYVYYNNL